MIVGFMQHERARQRKIACNTPKSPWSDNVEAVVALSPSDIGIEYRLESYHVIRRVPCISLIQ